MDRILELVRANVVPSIVAGLLLAAVLLALFTEHLHAGPRHRF